MSQIKSEDLFPPKTYLANSGHTDVAQIQRVNGLQFHAFLKPSTFSIYGTNLQESPEHHVLSEVWDSPILIPTAPGANWISPRREGK